MSCPQSQSVVNISNHRSRMGDTRLGHWVVISQMFCVDRKDLAKTHPYGHYHVMFRWHNSMEISPSPLFNYSSIIHMLLNYSRDPKSISSTSMLLSTKLIRVALYNELRNRPENRMTTMELSNTSLQIFPKVDYSQPAQQMYLDIVEWHFAEMESKFRSQQKLVQRALQYVFGIIGDSI
jgi:hypothetical protein